MIRSKGPDAKRKRSVPEASLTLRDSPLEAVAVGGRLLRRNRGMLVHKIFVDGMERRMMLEKERNESGMMCRVVVVYICVL